MIGSCCIIKLQPFVQTIARPFAADYLACNKKLPMVDDGTLEAGPKHRQTLHACGQIRQQYWANKTMSRSLTPLGLMSC